MPTAEYLRNWKRAHPELRLASDRRRDRLKVAARSKVGYLVRSGRLERPDHCPACGRVPDPDRRGRSRVEAHHPDHAQAFVIRWVCRECHLDADREAAA